MKTIFEYLINRKLTAKDANKHRIKEYEVVDLGLPSSTKWATCNIGADKPEEPGLLFQWGRVDGYKWGDKNNKFLSKEDYTTTSGRKYHRRHILSSEDDAAYQATGGELRMPTIKDIEELYNHTYYEWTELNNVNGIKFVSKKDTSKWIFIPRSLYFDEYFSDYKSESVIWLADSNDNNSMIVAMDRYGYLNIGRNRYTAFQIRPIKK